jgi:L-alanine-DL-glutamate epimerase-like enolase superfamily enzyme
MALTTAHEWHEIPLDTPFTISRGTREVSENAVVRVEDGDGHEGIGGATPTEYYGETRASMDGVLPDLLDVVESVGDPHNAQRVERRLRAVAGGPRDHPAARAAVSIAVHDLAAKRLGVPLYRQFGLDSADAPPTCHTVGLASTEEMRERAVDLVDAGFERLKLKLGTSRDVEIVSTVRAAVPDATLHVDANGAWGVAEAVEMTSVLADHDVAFVEQPVPAADSETLAQVAAASPVPVAADESCLVAADVPEVAEVVDIVVVKLAKTGGVRPAIRAIHTAHAHGLDVMLGCMTESNASIAAGCHLAPLCDWADLDGSLLLADDPIDGVPTPGGRIELARRERPGTAAQFAGE